MKTSVRIYEDGRDLETEELFFKGPSEDDARGRVTVLGIWHSCMNKDEPIKRVLNKDFFEAEKCVKEDLNAFPQMSFTHMIGAGARALLYCKMLENGSNTSQFGFVQEAGRQNPMVTAFQKTTDELVERITEVCPVHMADFKTHIFQSETSPS